MAQNNRQKFEEQKRIVQENASMAEKAQREIAMMCSHSEPTKKGEMRYTLYAKGDKVKCEQCGEEFSLQAIPLEEVRKAITVLNNAIQQVRAFSDPFSDEKIISELGRTAHNIKNMEKYYARAITVYGKNRGNKGKKKQRNNGYGFPG